MINVWFPAAGRAAVEIHRRKMSLFHHLCLTCVLGCLCVAGTFDAERLWTSLTDDWKEWSSLEPESLRFGAQICKATVQRKMFHKMLILQAVSFNFHFSGSVIVESLSLRRERLQRLWPRRLYSSCSFFFYISYVSFMSRMWFFKPGRVKCFICCLVLLVGVLVQFYLHLIKCLGHFSLSHFFSLCHLL